MTVRELEWTADDGVIRLILRRPDKRNAVTAQMWVEIADTLATLATDAAARVLSISGSGTSFCAGADLAAVRDSSGREIPEYRNLAEAGLQALRDFPRPTVAVVDGPCVGAGLLIALACDVRFASPTAKFAIPAVRYGLTVADVAVARLVELIGSGMASRVLLSGVALDGEQASSVGLVEYCGTDYVAEADTFVAAVKDAPAEAVALTKQAIGRVRG